MNQMTAVQISRPGAAFETVKRDIPEPGRSHVRIKVQACGVCHSDVFVKEGHWPALQYPRITGHEVAGVIDEIGSEVTAWKKGQRVGVGWHGAHCGLCVPCRRGDFISCQNLRVTGFNNDGGYAQYMLARADVLALIPETLSPVEAAPILCAGITTFNSLRHSGAVAGDLVAVQGLGGVFLDHLIYDRDAQLLNASFADYLLPLATDFPNVRGITLELRPSPTNPLGAKGAGEGGIVAVAATIGNAVAAALVKFGAEPRELPLTPARIWALIKQATPSA